MEQNLESIPEIMKDPPLSYWQATTNSPEYASLQEDMTVDTVVVGGGIVGVTTAYLLSQAGVPVALIEADTLGKGTTGHTTAKITAQHSICYSKLTTDHGPETALLYAQANSKAIDQMESIINKHHIDCDFQRLPAYVYTQMEDMLDTLEKEASTAANLGLPASFTQELPLPFPVKGALVFEHQAQFHPLKYLFALGDMIIKNGGRIFQHTQAVNLIEEEPFKVVTDQGFKISAKNVVIASHYPFWDVPGFYFTRIYPERSYLIAAKIKEAFPKGMFISAENPTRSLRSATNGTEEVVLFGGENHKTGHGKDTREHYLALMDFAKDYFPVEKILYRWSAQDYSTMDAIPYVGPLTSKTPHILVATGFDKWGMTNGTAAAMILTDYLLEKENPYSNLYLPSRKTFMASAGTFLSENADVAVNLIGGKIIPGDPEENLQPGEGKVIERDGQRVGAYCDPSGKTHYVDTTCTHLGCEVKWNNAEATWDCPCHGSRFSYEGKVLEGPALVPLKTLEEADSSA